MFFFTGIHVFMSLLCIILKIAEDKKAKVERQSDVSFEESQSSYEEK